MYFTHVATICNVPAMPPILPQVLFVGSASLIRAQFRIQQAGLSQTVHLKRMPKGRNNADEHKVIIQLLGFILADNTDYQPVLTFDAAPLHLAPKVLQEIRNAGFLFRLVPARLAWLAQPLDRLVFSEFKLYLKQKFAEALFDAFPNVEKVPRMIR